MYIYISIYALSQVTNLVMTIFLHKNTNFFPKKNRNISKGKKKQTFFFIGMSSHPRGIEEEQKITPRFFTEV